MKPLKFDDFPYLGRQLSDNERRHLQAMQQITPELFIKFLMDKGAKTTCLSCGRVALFIPHITVHDTDPDLPDYDGANDWEYVVPVHKNNASVNIHDTRYEVSCSCCGFISAYSAQAVIQWAKDKGYIVWEGF